MIKEPALSTVTSTVASTEVWFSSGVVETFKVYVPWLRLLTVITLPFKLMQLSTGLLLPSTTVTLTKSTVQPVKVKSVVAEPP